MNAIVRTLGGPFPGDRISDASWPLPEKLPDPEGRGEYVKVAESQLTEDVPGILRGAQYEWRPFRQPPAQDIDAEYPAPVAGAPRLGAVER